MLSVPSDAEIWNTSPQPKFGDDFTFLSPRDVATQGGQELYLAYGAHSNRTLFVEYGFVNDVSAKEPVEIDYSYEADVEDVLEQLFQGREAVGVWMRSVLEDEGYWGYGSFTPV